MTAKYFKRFLLFLPTSYFCWKQVRQKSNGHQTDDHMNIARLDWRTDADNIHLREHLKFSYTEQNRHVYKSCATNMFTLGSQPNTMFYAHSCRHTTCVSVSMLLRMNNTQYASSATSTDKVKWLKLQTWWKWQLLNTIDPITYVVLQASIENGSLFAQSFVHKFSFPLAIHLKSSQSILQRNNRKFPDSLRLSFRFAADWCLSSHKKNHMYCPRIKATEATSLCWYVDAPRAKQAGPQRYSLQSEMFLPVQHLDDECRRQRAVRATHALVALQRLSDVRHDAASRSTAVQTGIKYAWDVIRWNTEYESCGYKAQIRHLACVDPLSDNTVYEERYTNLPTPKAFLALFLEIQLWITKWKQA